MSEGFRPAYPADGPFWLRAFGDSIASLFRRIMPAPFRLAQYATADLPTAADYKSGIVYDTTASWPKHSDGTEWKYIGFPLVALVRMASNLVGNFTMATAVGFDQEVYDTGGFHSNVTNNSRLTAPRAGVARLSANIAVAGLAAGEWLSVNILKNASVDYDGTATQILYSDTVTAAQGNLETAWLPVSAGDYFQVRIQVESDTSTTVVAVNTWFMIEFVG